jgi:hypothetical protein
VEAQGLPTSRAAGELAELSPRSSTAALSGELCLGDHPSQIAAGPLRSGTFGLFQSAVERADSAAMPWHD